MAIDYPYVRPGPITYMDISGPEETILNKVLQQKEPNCELVRQDYTMQRGAVNCNGLFLKINDGRQNQSAFWRSDFIETYLMGALAAIRMVIK